MNITNKKIRYKQYQGKNNVETVYNSPHILVLQNKSKIDETYLNNILSPYIF